MARYREDFSLYRRKMASGRVVFYYQTYDEDGRRTPGRSTGQTTKTAARAYCIGVLKAGQALAKRQAKVPTFGEYAKGWWDYDTCPYLQRRKKQRDISRSYALSARARLDRHILPCFGKTRLDKITTGQVEVWLDGFATREKGKLSNSSANLCLRDLKLMFDEAVRRGLLTNNPAKQVVELRDSTKKKVILSLEEARRLFSGDVEQTWGNHLNYMMNKLAAYTGMRLGEVMGLRGEYVFDDHVEVRYQWTRLGYGALKTHDSRLIPIPADLRQELQPLLDKNGDGFVFARADGAQPIAKSRTEKVFHDALVRIGISEAEQKNRFLCFHSWRHFLNTRLRVEGVAIDKVQAVTGHKSEKMTDLYTHWNPRELSDVIAVQSALFSKTKEVDDGKAPVEFNPLLANQAAA